MSRAEGGGGGGAPAGTAARQGATAPAARAATAAPQAPTGLAASLRGAWRLARVAMHGLHGLAVVLFVFPHLDLAARQVRIRWWAGRMFRLFGMRLEVSGPFRPGAKLLVANHVSWLDILAVHAACPEARFVSKAEVRHWPLVNRLVDAARTLYLQRERARDALRVVHEMAQALQHGDTVAVFPEGTTGTGHELLPFHANLLQAAISTGTPAQPVVLRYADADAPVSTAVDFTGDITLVQSLWALARARRMVVSVQVLTAQGTLHADRRALAERLRQLIAEALRAQRGV
ncbi:MAG: 1-acyl-sn-glycerol-3-phosphate acyltransferase [Burkholderiales bacterium]|nr:1-acyl-sn-glycerol-3-phosphate acyltransferase [Burkholderiales bacterium]